MSHAPPPRRTKSRYRGSGGDLQVFAPRFIEGRMQGFEKDMSICLAGIPTSEGGGLTHAYFPALAACCGAIEYLGALSVGQRNPILRGLSRTHITDFARRYLPQPDYDAEAVRILWDLFRNGTAHHGITSGVWVDHHPAMNGRRLTWSITEKTGRPALSVQPKAGTLDRDPPWDTTYTHVATLMLGQVASDVIEAAGRLAAEIALGGEPLNRFRVAMEALYPH